MMGVMTAPIVDWVAASGILLRCIVCAELIRAEAAQVARWVQIPTMGRLYFMCPTCKETASQQRINSAMFLHDHRN